MADDGTRRAHAIFKRLLELEASEREAHVERLCEGDGATERAVRRLLGALSISGEFLEATAHRGPRIARDADLSGPRAPSIPGFRIERLIGVGGMAAVYEATQEWPRRRVALKVIRSSMFGTTALRRFELETEALARLRHPGIARLHEAGTFDDGAGAVPFLAMEFIEGAQPITDFCDERELGVRERLALMADVCDAVAHGHQNSVVHRDLKPGNVLVDSAGAPRVIDFGIARLTHPGDLDTRQTTHGQLVGTLNYMSPEQCRSGATVDARTDVYSLGVMLYELLCHRRPHDLTGVPVHEALRIIHESAPARPSERNPSLRGDVEAILLKALEKEPQRRYRTIEALGTDIRRFLADQPIEARPPTLFSQMRLFTRRNRTLVAAALAIGFTLIAATAVSVTAALRARRAEATASTERDIAEHKAYVASIAAALSSFQFSEFAEMRSRLDAAPPSLRGWEWRFLNGLSERSINCVQAHDDMIFAMAADQGRSRLATAARDGTISMWSLPDLSHLATSRVGDGTLFSIAFVPGTELLAAASAEGAVLVVEGMTGVVRHTLRGAGGAAMESASVRDAFTIAGASRDGAGLIWDLREPESPRLLEDQPGAIHGVRYSDDGALLATWGREGTVCVRDASTLAVTRRFAFPGGIACVALRTDLGLIAVGGANGCVLVWELASGIEWRRIVMRDAVSMVRAVAFSQGGSLLAAGQGDRTITLVNLREASRVALLTGHGEAISELLFIDDDQRIVSSSWDRTLRLWTLEESIREPIMTLSGHEGRILGMAIDPTDSFIASGGDDGTIRIWDLDLGFELATLREHGDAVHGVTFSPDGALMASASHDDTIKLWRVADGACVRTLTGHAADVWCVDFAPGGTLLASGGDDCIVRVWNLAPAGARVDLAGHAERVTHVRFSHDGRILASASRDGTVRLWSMPSGELIHGLRGHEADVFALAWSEDDSRLFSGSRDQTIRVWCLATGTCTETLAGNDQFVTSLALAPGDSRLAAGSWFGSVVLLERGAATTVASFKAHAEPIRALSFSSDGRRLVTASHDGTLRILDSATAREQMLHRRACVQRYAEAEAAIDAGRPLTEAEQPWAVRVKLRRAFAKTSP